MMTETQLVFFRALCAPFREDELSTVPARGGKRELTYLDKRALENRLDTVCGPTGWYPEYESTARGYKCRLHIYCPMPDGSWAWLHKEDGAGFEEMGSKNRETGEWEPDVDNDEKSGYTNALRRAAQDAWGMGRYLYKKGIPGYLDPEAKALDPNFCFVDPNPTQTKLTTDNFAPVPKPVAKPATSGRQYDNFRVPKPGKAVFAWAKSMETHFGTALVEGMKKRAKELGLSGTFTEWTQDQVNEICGGVIAYLKALPNYAGEFEGKEPPRQQAAQAPAANGLSLDGLKKQMIQVAKAVAEKQLGREPAMGEIKHAIEQVSAAVNNGEVLTSIKECTDRGWLERILGELTRIANTSQEDADCPF
jgi:hypothetical protein